MSWPDSIHAGETEQPEPLVRRVLAPNPSPYTYTGTQTWIVGAGKDVAVIDPGPDDAAHIDAISSIKSAKFSFFISGRISSISIFR